MLPSSYRDLFRIAPGPIPAILFARVALAVGLPLIGFTLAGNALAGVAGGATAMFVSQCDVGVTRRGRVGTMLLGLLCIAFGGIVGDRFGGTMHIDEVLVLVAAFVAAWVSNSHPGIAAVARFSAVMTVAGVGLQLTDPTVIGAIFTGGACAIGSAYLTWVAFGIAPDKDFMDWRAGLRRALAGAGTGPWFACCYAATATVSFVAASGLGVTRPYWATLTVIMVMRREGTVSRRLTLQYMAGTLLGIPVADVLSKAAGAPIMVALLATVAAASARLGMAANPALGFAAFTVCMMLLVDLALHGAGAPAQLLVERLYDVGAGCMLALVGTLVASARGGDAKAA
jgi:hypothetical protein